ncbi:MAG: ROK family protein [Candidatus Pacebacteria bacterium]|nr:ROK family protein [Candidatus Paceibacterota bacterium]
MAANKSSFLGYDIGGTKIAVCVGDSTGRVLASERIEGGTQRPYRDVLPDLVRRGRKLVGDAGLSMSDIESCGISAPGPLDIGVGVIEKSPNMIWADVPIRDDLSRGLGVPAILENDGNAGALAEWFFGAGKGCRNMIYFTMSTGIGGGVIANGRLVQGNNGNAGELGHAILDIHGPPCGCGMRGCFEAFCGGRNVARRLKQMVQGNTEHPLMQLPSVNGDPDNLRYETLREGVAAGIPVAEEFWDDLCLRMAQGLGMYMMVFNPEKIILGTIFYYSGDMLMEPVRRYLPRFAWAKMRNGCRLELPALGSKLGELAGTAVALYARHGREEF